MYQSVEGGTPPGCAHCHLSLFSYPKSTTSTQTRKMGQINIISATSLLLTASSLAIQTTVAFGFSYSQQRTGRAIGINTMPTRSNSQLNLSGGFGGGGGDRKKSKTKTSSKMNPRDAKRATQQLIERYGGDIGKGTQSRIEESLDSLEPHLKEAAELYKQVTQFDALITPMIPADRNRLIPPVQFQMAEADRKKLQSLMEQHSLSERDLHNVFQQITWDASADAKATRADIAGNTMKPELQERISIACSIAVAATSAEGARGKLLDVGCGHGSIVRSLVDAGLEEPDMYVGIDLSSEMVKNAIERYGSARNGRTGKGRVFVADDFLTHDYSVYGKEGGKEGVFDSVIFCSALHDLPDMEATIGKAAEVLRSNGGKIVVVHAQGAMVCAVFVLV